MLARSRAQETGVRERFCGKPKLYNNTLPQKIKHYKKKKQANKQTKNLKFSQTFGHERFGGGSVLVLFFVF